MYSPDYNYYLFVSYNIKYTQVANLLILSYILKKQSTWAMHTVLF